MIEVELDIECYRNYFLVMCLFPDGRHLALEQYEHHSLDTETLHKLLTKNGLEFFTFNGNGYDMPMLKYALAGATCEQLKEASDAIIVQKLKPWDFPKRYPSVDISPNHVDLIEVAPGMVGLKLYGGRLHTPKLQDLPIAPDAEITADQRTLLRRYCKNDLFVTRALKDSLREQIELRRTMGADLGEDIRSKSDAQIAESVLKKRVKEATGMTPRKHQINYTKFKYTPPAYVRFGEPSLKHALEVLTTVEFHIKPDTGHIIMPAEVEALDIQVGGTKYTVGIGGLHSKESEVSHFADENTVLCDIDVRSYYPNLILNMGMYPDSMGPTFLKAYRDILVERLAAKDAKDKVKDATLKITLNGTFGKTSNQYSVLYNPKMMLHTTLGGQLSILMLIEGLEQRGIPVVSANTDGIVVKCPKDKEELLAKVVKVWEGITNLETERTDYVSIHSRDVNSYVAVKPGGGVKLKGFFGRAGLWKNPQNEVCVDALVAYITKQKPIHETIYECTDIRKFLTLRTVKGGAFKEGYELGKAIRWYYAVGETGVITYLSNGNTVGRSKGAKPCMELPDALPADLDHQWYIDEAEGFLMDVGLVPRPEPVKLPRRNSKLWKQMFADGNIDEESNTWCGHGHPSDLYSEYKVT